MESTYIEKIETEMVGGGAMLDIITLKTGVVLTLTDTEVVARPNIEHYYEGLDEKCVIIFDNLREKSTLEVMFDEMFDKCRDLHQRCIHRGNELRASCEVADSREMHVFLYVVTKLAEIADNIYLDMSRDQRVESLLNGWWDLSDIDQVVELYGYHTEEIIEFIKTIE